MDAKKQCEASPSDSDAPLKSNGTPRLKRALKLIAIDVGDAMLMKEIIDLGYAVAAETNYRDKEKVRLARMIESLRTQLSGLPADPQNKRNAVENLCATPGF